MKQNISVTRRRVLKATGATIATGLAGCTSSGYQAGSSDSDENSEGELDKGGLGKKAGSDALGYSIDYWGQWSGSLTAPSKTRSISGTGFVNGRVYPLPDYLGLSVQKREEGSDRLMVKSITKVT
jgi:hypothetical protein